MADEVGSSQVSTGEARAVPTDTTTRSDRQSSSNAKLHSSSLNRSSEKLELAFRDLTYQVKLKPKYRTPGAPKEKKILSGITGIFRPGRLAAIMGSSGAGKTTLLSVLAGNAEGGTIEGSILVNGEPYSGTSLQDISGFVFQDDLLLASMKVREAIAMSALLRLSKSINKEERRRRVNETLGIMHLEKAQNTIVGSPLQKGISGGERKRTAIGMEMVVNPAMLFLDEPTTGLDPRTRAQMWETIRRLVHEGSTILLTTQYLDEADQLADRVAVIDRGRVVAEGTVDTLKSSIGSASLQITLQNPEDRTTARERISQGLKLLAAEGSSQGRLTIPLTDVEQVTDVLILFRHHHIAIAAMSVQKPSLDEVFLALTGHDTIPQESPLEEAVYP